MYLAVSLAALAWPLLRSPFEILIGTPDTAVAPSLSQP